MNNKNLRQRIISELMKSDGLTISQLTEKASASRVSISKELQSLKLGGIVKKAQGSHKHVLSSDIAFIIFKIYQDSAELVTYSLDRLIYEREPISLVYSLPYEDNIIFLSQRVDKCRQILQRSFKRVITCIIHDKRITYTPRIFDKACSRSELIARHIRYVSDEEAVLYISNTEPISLICKNGHAITPPAYPSEKSLDAFQSILSFVKPTRVILEGKEQPMLSIVCTKHNIPLQFIESVSKPFSDEQEIIEETLLEISKPI